MTEGFTNKAVDTDKKGTSSAEAFLAELEKKINDFEWAGSRICFRLINAERNRGLLAHIPHRPFLDLAIVYYLWFEPELHPPW